MPSSRTISDRVSTRRNRPVPELHEPGVLLTDTCLHCTNPRESGSTPVSHPVTPSPRAVRAPRSVGVRTSETERARRATRGCFGGPSRGGGSAGIRTQGGYEPHRLSRSAPSAARTRYLAQEVTRTAARAPTRRPAVSVTTDVRPSSAAVGEECRQEGLGLLGPQAGAHLDLMVGPGVAHDVAHRAAGPGPRLPGPQH